MIAPVVDAAWTAAHLDEVVLADVRWYLDGRPGRAEYDRGHLPGAVFVELEDWLAAPANPRHGRHPLPDPEVFARGMAELGIGDDDTVVAYDDQGGVVAARLVWMLRVTGHEAALLDGGIAAWEGPLETAPVRVAPAFFSARPWPEEALASADDAADPANAVIDARQRERYLGEGPDPVDPRPGHIPGARSLPAREHLGPDGRLLEPDELRARFAAAGVDGSRPVVSYCGSGVTATHNLLVLEHAGLGTGRLYAGSWSQWSNDHDRPAATGAEG
jgi:thiosulfate/3-mercaptopyruvate sulfurtransferase